MGRGCSFLFSRSCSVASVYKGLSANGVFFRPYAGLRFPGTAKARLCRHSSPTLHLQCSTSVSYPERRESIACVPLSERAAEYRSSVKDLLKWREWAQGMAMSVGDKYLLADGGPNSNDLLRELEWMLEDAVSHILSLSMASSSEDYQKPPPKIFQERPCVPLRMQEETTPVLQYRDASEFVKTLKRRGIKGLDVSELQSVVYLRASLEELSNLWVERVHRRRPFQYIVSSAHWRDFVLFVKEGVLIPRPETEQMIDLAQEVINAHPVLSEGVWADLGTGSGALSIGIASILHPQGSVVAVDTSEEALFVASINIQKYGFQDKVKLRKGSWFSPLEDMKGKLAGILSNPPYIPSSHIPALQAEVALYEPRCALDGGEHGIDDLFVICKGATWALQSGGCIILETNGGDQAESVGCFLERMQSAPFCNVELIKDYAGVVRFVRACRK
ncbi:hypothetical protein KP509_17G016300 [Ceratopteris richardii]|uniref:Methyltransferase domain-containing protein n=1 Tax=Ceratopteris richardii TaxID=49495 RepID=A0A8T2STY8_CERRI|nr:hypothetical protein KP509_17G016300 [Ceratopteris richardii]